ncbi:tRNA lysidine(34) synthetase TilS [uncultured Mameliella sp.]|uniref:tRNA lysidine(34) synthetase TilS n=1 Tax=uncultured Mameliella sp. TaxID=1447087 RepID=UPI00262E84AD|nr:tRNA lysidine(34) synthetase TilS [uncultured Mameliella sp.]
MSLDQRFAEAMGQLLGPDFPSEIGLAVSGGGDSMAMLTLAHNWTRVWGVRLRVVTVDHGLRPESADEAAMVAGECATLGWPHTTLRWHWDGAGNKMDAARRGRLALIDEWRGALSHVLMAHTRDDVAETFLMRLARGSGVDGLAAMSARREVGGMQVLRPCLDIGRAELRHYLTVLKTPWAEDPSNEDPAYGRVRMRRLLSELQAEGLGAETLADTAARLRDDRVALAMRAATIWDAVGRQSGWGGLMLAPDWYEQVETATQRRLLSAMMRFVSGAEYAPRAEALEGLRDRLVSGGGGTLHGCEVIHHRGRVLMFREAAAVAEGAVIAPGIAWDGRWQVAAPGYAGCTIRALGEDGWRQVTEKPPGGPPFRAALSLPSIWRGDSLLACDALGVGPGNTARLCRAGVFRDFLLSH